MHRSRRFSKLKDRKWKTNRNKNRCVNTHVGCQSSVNKLIRCYKDKASVTKYTIIAKQLVSECLLQVGEVKVKSEESGGDLMGLTRKKRKVTQNNSMASVKGNINPSINSFSPTQPSLHSTISILTSLPLLSFTRESCQNLNFRLVFVSYLNHWHSVCE